MPFIDGIPAASSVAKTDLVWLGQGGTGVPGTAIARSATLSEILVGPLDIIGTGQFFAQNGAVINRIADRLFVGPATANDGAYPNLTKDWLQTFLATPTGGSEIGPMVGATMSVLSINGEFGFVSGSRTSDNPTAGSDNTVGIASYAINDNTTNQSTAYAYYGEARRLSGVNNELTIAMELDASNQGTLVLTTPYQQLPGQTVVFQCAAGCGVTLPGANDVSVGISIQGNPTQFGAGIEFAADAIRGTDGITGAGDAIIFAKGHTLTWYSSDGNQTAHIQCQVSDHTLGTTLEFNNTGVVLQNAFDGGILMVVPPEAHSVNWVTIAGAPTGGQVGVLAGGSDPNVDMKLWAQGTGVLDLGTPTSTTASVGGVGTLPATVAGYIQIKISGTLHKVPYYAV